MNPRNAAVGIRFPGDANPTPLHETGELHETEAEAVYQMLCLLIKRMALKGVGGHISMYHLIGNVKDLVRTPHSDRWSPRSGEAGGDIEFDSYVGDLRRRHKQ